MPVKVNWSEAIKPLLKAYHGKKHPLDYENVYQLVVMVILSAEDSDRHINSLAPEFFKAFPDMQALSASTPETLRPFIGKVRNFKNKVNWIIGIAKEIKKNSAIPLTLDELTKFSGIGRKSANVILREAGKPAEGVMVDLHTVRVAPRLGIATGTDPKKIEAQIMEQLPRSEWDAGMAMSFHGREICRPKPMCDVCFMRDVCQYYINVVSKHPDIKGSTPAKKTAPKKAARAAKKVEKKAATKTAKKAVAKSPKKALKKALKKVAKKATKNKAKK